jgi:hypothetical protein
MKSTIIGFFCLLFAGLASAQDNNKGGILAIGLGGAVNYYYGPSSRNFDNFESDHLNGQLEGLLGLSLGRTRGGNRTLLAAFGTFGINNRSTLAQIFADQGYVAAATSQSSMNSFYRLEGGLLLAEVFRISTGVGQQMFNEQALVSTDAINLNATYLQYYSSTVGFQFNVSSAAIMVNVNFAYGKDFKQTVLTPAAGILFRL